LDKEIPDENLKLKIYDGLFLIYIFEKNCKKSAVYINKFLKAAEKYGAEYQERSALHKEKYAKLCNAL
jgi:hypothetical protein